MRTLRTRPATRPNTLLAPLALLSLVAVLLLAPLAAQAQSPGNASSYPPPEGGNPPPPGHRGPPPEALAACKSLAANAACSFVTPRRETLQGTCRKVPEGALACVPNHMPGREGGPNHGPDGGPNGGPPPDGPPPQR